MTKLKTEFQDVLIFGKCGLRLGIFTDGADHYIDYNFIRIDDRSRQENEDILKEWAVIRIAEITDQLIQDQLEASNVKTISNNIQGKR